MMLAMIGTALFKFHMRVLWVRRLVHTFTMVKRGAAKAATTPVQKSKGVTKDMAASTEKIPKPVANAKAAMEKAG
eukprot:8128406-Pyramimonas_sp.AAC.1